MYTAWSIKRATFYSIFGKRGGQILIIISLSHSQTVQKKLQNLIPHPKSTAVLNAVGNSLSAPVAYLEI